MSARLIHTLLSPSCYPHPVADIRLLETHISWVLLTGDFAYKIKKPVKFAFVDFSTLALRKHYCAEELRLNSRFSSGLYLAVVAISGSVAAPCVDGKGEALEYAVKMRQFAQDQLLDALAQNHALGSADMSAIAATLAAFHQQAARGAADTDSMLGSADAVASAALENFAQMPVEPLTATARFELERLRRWTEQQVDSLHPLFEARRAQGFVRECHGDLHLRNIARIDGAITFFDCIEFNLRLRWIDVQSELAFLLMDIESRGLHALGNRLLNGYLESTGDYAGLAVLQFYKVYRAIVRAKVLLLKLASTDVSADESSSVLREAATYLQLAQSYCAPRRPFLALMHGISGSGKSTIAAELAAGFGAIRIRSDVERKRLFGLAADARSEGSDKQRLYSEAASLRTFAALEALAERLLGLGYPVIVDATFIAARWRRPFFALARKLRQPCVILDCQARPATIEQRLALRAATKRDASEADIGVMRAQREKQETFAAEEAPHVFVIDTERLLDAQALRDHLEGARRH